MESMDRRHIPSVLRLISMNIHGRFKGREIKEYGQFIIRYLLKEKTAAMLFGQQTNFLPNLPENYEYMGGTRAFMLYDTTQLHAGDEKHYKLYLRDLEQQDRLPKNYLPENNFVISKMRTKSWPSMEFIAISFHTDECFGKLRSTSLFRKLCIFLENLLEIEEMPIIVSGAFRISLEDAKQIIPPDFRCCGYIPSNRKRSIRQSNFYICTKTLVMGDVRPMVCGKMDVSDHIIGSLRRFINPEDIFYWDPVAAFVHEKDQGHIWDRRPPIGGTDVVRIPQEVQEKHVSVEPQKVEQTIKRTQEIPDKLMMMGAKTDSQTNRPLDEESGNLVPNRFGYIKHESPTNSSPKGSGAMRLKPYYEALKSINVSFSNDKAIDQDKEQLLSASQPNITERGESVEFCMPPGPKLPGDKWQESKDSLLSLSGESQFSSDMDLSSSQDLPRHHTDSELLDQPGADQKRKEQMKKAASFVELYDEETINNNTGVCYMQ